MLNRKIEFHRLYRTHGSGRREVEKLLSFESMSWKTLRKYPSVIEAQIAQTKLESEEIECFVRDEYLANIMALYTNALGGIRLDVQEADFERATQILQEVDASVEKIVCPQCGSDRVKKNDWSWRLAFLSLFALTVPLPFQKKRRKCDACGESF